MVTVRTKNLRFYSGSEIFFSRHICALSAHGKVWYLGSAGLASVRRGAPGARAGIPLQLMEETMLKQVFPEVYGKDHDRANIHTAAHEEPHNRGLRYSWK